MGTIRRVSGGPTPDRGYPLLLPVTDGMPSANLQSLLWFEDGTNGVAHPGPYLNTAASGGPDATLYRGGNPTKQSFGLATNADGNGIVINTLVPFTRDFTVLSCLKSTVNPSTSQYIGWCAPTAHGFPAVPSNSFANNLSPWPVRRVHGAGSTPAGNGGIILDNSATEVPAGTNPILREEVAPTDEATVQAYRCTANIGGTNGRLELITLPTRLAFPADYGAQSPNFQSVNNAALHNWFSTYEAASTFMVGAWPFGTLRPCTAELYAFAVYDVILNDDVLAQAMRAMAKKVEARGVDVFGNPFV